MGELEERLDKMGARQDFAIDAEQAKAVLKLLGNFISVCAQDNADLSFSTSDEGLRPISEFIGSIAWFAEMQTVEVGDMNAKILEILNKLPESASRVSDTQAEQMAINIMAGTMTGVAVLETIGIVAEALSLGQIETVTAMIQDLMSLSGMPDLTRELFKIPYIKACLIPYEQLYNKKYTPYIPSATDLVRMRLREAIDEKQYNDALAYQGFSEIWGKGWWDAHWVLPSLSQIYEMFYRGMNIPFIYFDSKGKRSIGSAETDEMKQFALEQFLKIADYEDIWHDGLLELSKKLPSKMDLRLMSQRITLDPEMTREVIKAEGLREDWIEPYAETVLNYRLGDLYSSTVNSAKRLFKNGMMELEELQNALTNSHYSKKEAEVYINIASLELREEEMKDALTIVINHFRRGRLTSQEVITTLTEVGYTTDKAQLLHDMELARMAQLPEEVEGSETKETTEEEPT